jgi:hypothetical protein
VKLTKITTGGTRSTRDRIWDRIFATYDNDAERLGAWASTNLIAAIPEDEWVVMHAGTCAICGGSGARLYAQGWRDAAHAPRVRS